MSAFTAESKGAVRWRFVADSYQSAKGSFVVLVDPKSSIRKPEDLAGKTIAVPALQAIGTLTISAALGAYGLRQDAAKFVEMPFPQMGTALQKGQVDAIWVAEPFITNTHRTLGARAVLDTSQPGGPTAEFPIAGWGIMGSFAQKNPKTIAAFQRAIGRAQQLATTDRTTVVKTLQTYVKGIDADTASVVTLGTYPTSLNQIRLQRVADLMLRYGYLKKRVDVAPMLMAAPSGTK